MSQRVKLVWYKKNWYHPNFFTRGPRCLKRAKGICQHCGKKKGDTYKAKTGRIQKVVLQPAHLNHDPENPRAVLLALCKQCHMSYDNAMHVIKARRTHYRKIYQAMLVAGQLELFSVEPAS